MKVKMKLHIVMKFSLKETADMYKAHTKYHAPI